MQIPEVLLKQNVIGTLNIIGLGGVGVGLVVLYRALVSRSKLLSEGLGDIKKAYQSVLDLMDRRAALIDKRFEDEKAFHSYYLMYSEDSDVHIKRLQAVMESEVSYWKGKVERRSEELKEVEEDLRKLTSENRELRAKGKKLEEESEVLKSRNRELSPPRPPNVRGLH